MGETVNYVGKRSISTEPLNPASDTCADVNIKLVFGFMNLKTNPVKFCGEIVCSLYQKSNWNLEFSCKTTLVLIR